MRLKKAGKIKPAISAFQAARSDTKRKALVLVELGECFQKIEQYKLALAHYEQALEACEPTDLETRKLALYRSGVLATGLRELDRAERHLAELAGMDFGYRDVRTGWTKSPGSAIVGDSHPFQLVRLCYANSVSAKKRLRQSLDRRARNRTVRSAIRNQVRKVRTTIAGGDAAASETEFRITVKKLDQAAAKNILHANASSRLKSRSVGGHQGRQEQADRDEVNPV